MDDSRTPPLFEPAPEQERREPPAFNLPGVVLVLGALFLAIQAAMSFVSLGTYVNILNIFAFIPGIWTTGQLSEAMSALSPLVLTSPLTYGFLHADWVHLFSNLLWMAAFGSVVARRFGAKRFLAFMAAGSLAAILAHVAFNWSSFQPVIGASGAVSACMGAAIRFAFAPNELAHSVRRPPLGIVQSLQNRTIMVFVIVWFAFNWLFGAGIVPIPGVEGQIAWEAHMGGFLFGMLAFRLFDPWPVWRD